MDITKDLLAEKFNEYNNLYFEGKLEKCEFRRTLKSSSAFGMYREYEKRGKIQKVIFIGRNIEWTEETLKETLVHEMIHMYVSTIEGKKFDGILGHGRRFRWHCKRIKRDYGLIIKAHSNFEYTKKELKPKLWEKVLLWLIDR